MIKSISIPQEKIIKQLVWKALVWNKYNIMNTPSQSFWIVLVPTRNERTNSYYCYQTKYHMLRQYVLFKKKHIMACMRVCPQETLVQEQIRNKVVTKEIPKSLLFCPYIKKGGKSHMYYTNQNWWVLITFINTAQDDMEQAVHNTAFIYMLCNSPLCPKLFFYIQKNKGI